jgi:putative endonuclease
LKSPFDRLRRWYVDWRFGCIDTNARLGTRGEQAAARMLRQTGYTIIAESESDFGGEIDLIATDHKRSMMIFIEVKTLQSIKPGHPADRVDEVKQARVTKAALRYLQRKRMLGCPVRFDVVAVWWPKGHDLPTKMEHYPGAFEATGVDGFYS